MQRSCSLRSFNKLNFAGRCLNSRLLASQPLNRQVYPAEPLAVTYRTQSSRLLNVSKNCRYYSSKSNDLKGTPLYDLHIRHGGKMVLFGGFSMPVQYDDLSVGESHRWTREKASLFDVSHMLQHKLRGPAASTLLSKITPTSLSSLQDNHSTLSCLLHPGTGGIVDDTIVTRLGPDSFYMVTNAGCRDKDTSYIASQIQELQGGKPEWEVLDGQGLVALQGPLSAQILKSALYDQSEIDLSKFYFGQYATLRLRLKSGSPSPPILVGRGGYTGEDGFEMSIPSEATVEVTEALLESAGKDNLRLAGLGARDSLRLEAGMCLYGHDLDDSTSPVEAGLSWIIGKDRRVEGGFHGSDVILQQLKPKKDGGGVSRKRIGLVIEGAPAREGAEVVDEDGEPVGKVTSGSPSPTLGKNIAMAYVKTGVHKTGTELGVMVRGKRRKAVVTKIPFVPSRYLKE